MPVIRDIALSLEKKEVLRRVGIRGRSHLRKNVTGLLDEVLAQVNDQHLLEPVVAYEFYAVTGVHQDALSLGNDTVLHGSLLSSAFSSAVELVVVVCTIGSRLEEQVTAYFKRDEPLRGLLLDGIGSAAVDSLTQEVCQFVTREASVRGGQVSSPLNPGMSGFSLSEQWPLFQLVPAEAIGVSLTSSGLMVPRKSVSMVYGIGQEMPRLTLPEVCAHCSLGGTCPYRISVG